MTVLGAELISQPIKPVEVEETKRAQRVLAFMDQLEDHPDIQRVYANFDIPNEVLVKIQPARE